MSFYGLSQAIVPYKGFIQLGSDVYIQPGGGWGVPDPQIPNLALEDPLWEYGSSVNISRFSPLGYRDLFIQPLNQNLFPAPPPVPFFGLSLPIQFSPQSYRDSYFDASAILPVFQSPPNPFMNVWAIQYR